MGMSPTEVDKQSLWQFSAAWNGYVAANAPDDGKLTEREAEALFNWIDHDPAAAPGRLPEVAWDGNQLSLAHTPASHRRYLPIE